jgi:hypothetical protein
LYKGPERVTADPTLDPAEKQNEDGNDGERHYRTEKQANPDG